MKRCEVWARVANCGQLWAANGRHGSSAAAPHGTVETVSMRGGCVVGEMLAGQPALQ